VTIKLSAKKLKRKARSFIALFIVFSIVLMPISVIAQDVGADAGGTDADAGDAGGNDIGGADVGGADAGAGDADAADAGVGDAGAGDAGSGDVGEADVDAGGTDAGAEDAGGTDADAGDAGSGDAGGTDVAEGDSSEEAFAGGNSYVAGITPDGVVGVNKPTDFQITVAEVGDSQVGSFKLTLPSDKFMEQAGTQDVATEDSEGRIWTGGLVGYILSLHAQQTGVYLTQGQSVTASFVATPKATGTHTLTTEAWTDNNYGGSGGIKNNEAFKVEYGGCTYNYDEDYDLTVVVSETIQDAIDADAITDYSTIVVHEKTYDEKIDIDKTIHLKSANGPENTVIKGHTIDFMADEIILDGFTIDYDNTTSGRAIAPRGTSSAIIVNNIIKNAYRGIQGDYYGVPEYLLIADNVFEDTVLYGIAGTESMNGLWIEGNTFKTKAEAIGLGAGVVLVRDGQGGIFNNTFHADAKGEYVRIYNDALEADYLDTLLAENTFDRAVVVRGSGIKVPAIFSYIQLAIDAATDGDTVEVAPGTYNEKVYIKKPVNLQSVKGPESTIISYAGHHWPELPDFFVSNTITVFESGSGSTIDGFKILNKGYAGGESQVGIRVLDGVDGLSIINNIIDDVQRGILLNDHWTYNPAEINKNVSISNVIIEKNKILNSNMGIDIVFGDNITVDDNKIIFSSSAVHQPHVGISLRHGVSNIDIKNNLVQGYTGYPNHFGAGIVLGTDNNDWPYPEPNGIKNVNIEYNEFSNNAYGMIFGNWAGLVGWQNPVPMFNINTSHNLISNNHYGVFINPSAEDKAKEGFVLVVSQNDISDNSMYGIYAYSDFSGVDARRNWWGDASGPIHAISNPSGLGNSVSDNVLFDPWWVNEAMTRDSNYVEPTPGGGGGDFGGTDNSALESWALTPPGLPAEPTEEPPAESTTQQALTLAPEAPLVSPGLATVEFVSQGTAEELAVLIDAYDSMKLYFDENWEDMSESEYAQYMVDLAAAWAAILARETALLAEAGSEFDLDAAVEAYDAAAAYLEEYGELVSAEQAEAVLAAVAELIAQL
jgi:hypothetical protein